MAGVSTGTIVVATFTDPGGLEPNAFDPTGTLADHYSATINWGDGQTTAATLVADGQTVLVEGSHTYAVSGGFGATVTVHHENSPLSSAPNLQFAGLLYQAFLGRTGSQQELDFWGQQVPQLGTTQVAQGVQHSSEAMQRLVIELYQDILGRSPDPGGMAFFTNALEGGDSIEQVISSMTVGTSEFRNRENWLIGNANSDVNFVLGLYQVLLNRPANTVSNGELSFWLPLMQTQGPGMVTLGFTQSQAFRMAAVQSFYGIV